MKPAVYICLAMMLFLMVQPILISCQEKAKACKAVKSCCRNTGAAKPVKKHTDPRERTTGTGCNPFAACSQCHFTAALFTTYIAVPEMETGKKTSLYNEASCSDFTGDCWNPPELA